VDGNRGGIANSLKKAFTPDPNLFAALRAPFAAAFSTPITAAIISVAGVAALAFVGAFAAVLATAGLGAVFLGIGAAIPFVSKKSEELNTALGKLVATLKRVGETATAPLIAPLIAALNTLSKSAERIGPLLNTIFTNLAPAIGPLTAGIAGLVEEFLKILTADPATLEGIRDSLIALGDNLPRLGTALGTFFALFAQNENNVRNMGLLFGLLEFTIQQVAVSILALSAVLDGIIIAWNAVGDAISAAVGWITGTAVPAITGAASAVGQFFQNIPGYISAAWSAIVGFFSGIFNSVTGFLTSVGSSVISFFTNLPGRVVAALAAMPAILAGFFSAMISNLAYLVGFGLGSVVAFFMALPGRVISAITALPGLVAGIFNATWSAARSIVSSGISAVVGFFAQLPGRARAAISSLISIVSSVFSSARSAAVSQSSSLVSGAISVISSLPGRIRSALSSVRSAVIGAFAGAGSWLVGAGRSIIAGVARGIMSAIGGAVAAARAAASRIVQGFKDALKIGSPSKLMDLEVGRMIPAGAAQGIRANMGVLDTEMKNVRDMINRSIQVDMPEFTVPFSSQNRGGDGAQTVSLTIAPGAIVVQGQGRAAGEEAAEAILERLAAATLVK
jgi:phage-related protein